MLKRNLVMASMLAVIVASTAHAAVPAKPSISWMPTTYDSGQSISITWNMWWGTNGTQWAVAANGADICSATIAANGNNAQTGLCVADFDAGSYSLVARLCSADGCSESSAVTISVAGATGPDPDPDPDLPGSDCGIQTDANGKYTLCRSDIESSESAKTASDLFVRVKKDIQVLPESDTQAIAPGRLANPENVKRVERIVTPAAFEYMFSMRHSAYTYQGFLQAVGKFPGYCATYERKDSDAICRKLIATLVAHGGQETGAHDPNASIEQWRQSMYYLREAGCTEGAPGCGYDVTCDPNSWQGQKWTCGAGKQYYGRGYKQLSYNFNYGPFSTALFGDSSIFLQEPDKVATSYYPIASAIWFTVTPQSPKPSILHVVDGTWQPNAVDASRGIKKGFGATTNIVNGGIECGQSTDGINEKPQSTNRIQYYRGVAAYLGVDIAADEELGCAGQDAYVVEGAGGLLLNWDQDWRYVAENPGGKSFECKLVGYQTAYSALEAGDYEKCLVKYFDVTILEK
jgi:chitodextrinase